ncbi:MAG: cytidylyltransferase domain-containing protein, partial [Cyclobacteriaceae bacterium]
MIPAKSGFKKVKKKNLRLIDGKPLIFYVLKT